WGGFYQHEKRQRVSLPTYPFERKRFWAEPVMQTALRPTTEVSPVPQPESPLLDVEQPNAATPTTLSRKDRIKATLLAQLQELSGANLASLGPATTFLEAGFDSLFLAQASQAFEHKLGIKVSFRQLLEDVPTLNDLAGYFDKQLPAEAMPDVPAPSAISPPLILQRNAGKESKEAVTLPMTEAQMELWLATQLGDDASRSFNQVFLVHLRGSLHLEKLVQTLAEVVDRHDALRATFLPDGSGQKILPKFELNIHTLDISSLSNAEQEEKFAKVVSLEDETKFDLVNGPLIRGQAIKFSDIHHVLLLASHHIVMDGWSIGVVLNEVSRLYSAEIQAGPAQLQPAMQFSEYIQWQQAPESCEQIEEAEAYWLQQFAKPPIPVDLPTDRPRPPQKTYRAATRSLVLDSTFYQSLKQASTQQGCTLFNYLLASFNVWLYRLTGQVDLTVGVPAAGQIAAQNGSAQDNKALIGHCVNLLPVRSNCDGDPSFKDYLKSIKRLVLDAYEHQHFTFGSLVSKLNLPRDPSRVPLVSMTFNVVRVTGGIHFEELESEIILPPKGFNIFDLTFDLLDSDHDLRIECRFNTDLFDASTLASWLGHWKTLLGEMMANPALPISAFPILNENERKRLLLEWNDTAVKFPENQCFHRLFEAQVKLNPQAVAVIFEDRQLTYSELNKRANRLAHYLVKQGVKAGTLVGLCVERSLEMVVGLLGILKAGGAYVPLDPNYPRERRAFILQDARAAIILTQQSLLEELTQAVPPNAGNLTAQNPTVICLDPELTAIDEKNEENPQVEVQPENLAYVLFTSGSTGQPKGVQISHLALVNFLTSMSREPGLNATDVLLAVTTLSFDIAGLELWLPLTVGARVVIAKTETAMDGKRLAAQLVRFGVTVLQATPTTWQLLLESGWPGKPDLKILCGGEAWSDDLVKQLLPKCKSLWNMYGPTETTIWSAASKLEKVETPLIGKPIANTQFYVLNQRLQPVPVGVPGELHIGGFGLARGYLNRDKMTAEKFINDPFSSAAGARLYKTGDLARYQPNGKIEFLGRMDNQVKIRGYRIELGEIETVLRRHPNVRNLIVTAKEWSPGDKRLVAYIVPQQMPAATAFELRAFVGEHLPDYMVPSAFVTLDALPLTPNGKMDRKALPQPDASPVEKKFVPPGTATEIALAGIWCEVLKMKQISIKDNFFELGGNSLSATQLIARLGKFGEIEAILRDIFSFPTIASMSKWLEKQGNRQTNSTVPSLVPLGRKGVKPSSSKPLLSARGLN
ncbi:MAG: amino acid adenylation enzyme/thioester reductase family protein, partial [Pedosphaera sp.]|nr:amino acid adenylation enzyme/thioester reductase family protein [Pedosphaera sp.]